MEFGHHVITVIIKTVGQLILLIILERVYGSENKLKAWFSIQGTGAKSESLERS